MSSEFWETSIGAKFLSVDIPRIADALERIAKALEARNIEAEAKSKAVLPSPDKYGEIRNFLYGLGYKWFVRDIKDTIEKLVFSVKRLDEDVIKVWELDSVVDNEVRCWVQSFTNINLDGKDHRELILIVKNILSKKV